MMRYRTLLFLTVALLIAACTQNPQVTHERISSDKACARMVAKGLPPIAKTQTERFLGKVEEDTANCRGGEKAMARRDSVWLDWPNNWGAGDASTKMEGAGAVTELGKHFKAKWARRRWRIDSIWNTKGWSLSSIISMKTIPSTNIYWATAIRLGLY